MNTCKNWYILFSLVKTYQILLTDFYWQPSYLGSERASLDIYALHSPELKQLKLDVYGM